MNIPISSPIVHQGRRGQLAAFPQLASLLGPIVEACRTFVLLFQNFSCSRAEKESLTRFSDNKAVS